MKEIISSAQFGLSDKFPLPITLTIDFDCIAEQIDKLSERWPTHSGDTIRIIVKLKGGCRIYGHPTVFISEDFDESCRLDNNLS